MFIFNNLKTYRPKKDKLNAGPISRYSCGNATNMSARGKNKRQKAKACRNNVNITKTGINCQLNGELEKYPRKMFTIKNG